VPPPLPFPCWRSLAEPPPTSAQLFRDLQAELAAAFGGGGADGRLLTPDDARAALGAPRGADLATLLVAPTNATGSDGWWVPGAGVG
jgi:hypothetical protein